MFLGPFTGLVFVGPAIGIAATFVVIGVGEESCGGELGWDGIS
jgi:hypothetical protein